MDLTLKRWPNYGREMLRLSQKTGQAITKKNNITHIFDFMMYINDFFSSNISIRFRNCSVGLVLVYIVFHFIIYM